METFGIASVAAISLICYAIGMIIKSTEAIDNKYIPAIVLVVGAILGAVGMKIIPDYPATDIIKKVECINLAQVYEFEKLYIDAMNLTKA